MITFYMLQETAQVLTIDTIQLLESQMCVTDVYASKGGV